MPATRLGTCLLLAALTAAGTMGCGSVRFYRKTDHDLALKAQATFKEAKLRDAVIEERKRLDDFLQRELTASRRQVLATRDAQLLAIVGGSTNAQSWGELERATDARLERLVGLQHVATIVSAYNDLEAIRGQIARNLDAYRLTRSPSDPPALCPLNATSEPGSLSARATFKFLRDACQNAATSRPSSGRLATRTPSGGH